MEVLAGVSSVISILSLTIQLADGIKKASAFWESIKEAPDEIRIISKDLQVISNVLYEIQADQDQFQHQSSAIIEALGLCNEVLASLNHLTQKIKLPTAKTTKVSRKWQTMKAVLQIEKLEALQHKLDCAKMSLILARQNSSHHVNLQIYKSQQQLVSMIDNIKLDLEKRASQAIETRFQKPSDTYYHLEELKREASSLASSIKNPVTRLGFEQAMDAALSVLSNSVNIYETPIRQEKTIVQSFSNSKLFTISTPFGSVHIRTVTILFADCSYKLRSTITMHPSRFLQLCGVKFGIKFALSQSYGSLTHTLKGYRAVPDDAAIFKLCKEGRTDAISHLFDEGHASPFDTDSFGRTPLMMAIYAGKIETCKFLAYKGADLEAEDIKNNNLGSYALGTWGGAWSWASFVSGIWALAPASNEVRMEIARMYLGQIEVSNEWPSSSGIIGFRRLLGHSCLGGPEYDEPNRALFRWAMPMLQNQFILTSTLYQEFLHWLEYTVENDDIDTLDYLFKWRPHSVQNDDIMATIVSIVVRKMQSSDQTHLVHKLMSHGINLHTAAEICFPNWDSIESVTITTMALRSSAAFFRFKTTLQRLSIDIASFIQNEIQQGLIVAAGWNADSLQIVFNLNCAPIENPPYFLCWQDHYGNCSKTMAKEVSWDLMLNNLKKLKTGNASASNIEDILQERERNVVRFRDIDGRVCLNCGEVGEYYATKDKFRDGHYCRWKNRMAQVAKAAEEDSMFLLSL